MSQFLAVVMSTLLVYIRARHVTRRFGARVFLVGGSLNRGFTLLEILAALVIMGVVMVLAVPKFREFMTHENVRQARANVTTRLAGARSIAVQRGCEAVLHFDQTSSRVWVTACRPGGGDKDTLGLIENLSSRFGVVFLSTGDSILFTPQGIAFSASWITLTFSKDGYEAVLEISPVGRAQW